MSEILKIGIYQFDVIWEDIVANQQKIERLLKNTTNIPDILVLPEMYTTGFSMKPFNIDKNLLLKQTNWQEDISVKYKCAIIGSILFPKGKSYVNRCLYTSSIKNTDYYDKRHLFLTEKDCGYYSAGSDRKIFEHENYRIMPQICYDLRFPVWSRNNQNYQVLIYVSNWPSTRQNVWNTLLAARAIENQCYVVGVNRVGADLNNINYIGESAVYSPSGEEISKQGKEESYIEVKLSLQELINFRNKFPFYLDMDDFEIKNPGN